MKFKLFILLILIVFLVGCSGVETPTGEVIKEPVCNKPYILVGTDCCLDKNDNSICDSDEKTETIEDEVVIEKEISKKIETINEAKQHDIYVFGEEGFDPKELTINNGDKVSWTNEGHRDMILLIFKDGEQYLHQGSINSGDTFTHEFNEVGSYDIYWNIARGPVMGKLIVQDRSLDIIDEPIEEVIEQTKKDDAYTEEHLKEDLIGIFNTSRYELSNFTRDPSFPDYIRSSDLKYYTIHINKNKQMKTFKEFCENYCGGNWDGWQYYINKSEFDLFTPLLGKENFSNENEYKTYTQERILANHTQKETIYEVENGKVLEYKFWLLEQDNLGNFESNLLGYLLVYKVYCTPNMTVLIRPRWEDFSVGQVDKLSKVMANWELEDDRVREDVLKNVNKILKACPVEKEFFDNYDYKPYFKSDLRDYYWKVYYANDFNLTRKIEVGVKKVYKDEDYYVLENMNVSFINNHFYSLYGVGLRVIVKADDEKKEYDYYEKDDFRYEIKSGEKITKTLKQKEINFLHNITVMATLYIPNGDVDVRPLEVTFTKSDLGFE